MKTRLLDLGRAGRHMGLDPIDTDTALLRISPVDDQDRAEIDSFVRDGTHLSVAGQEFGVIIESSFVLDDHVERRGETKALLTIRLPRQ